MALALSPAVERILQIRLLLEPAVEDVLAHTERRGDADD
jgi:hypothetical protein